MKNSKPVYYSLMYSKRNSFIASAAFIVTLFAACSPALYQPLPEMATAQASLEELQAGRKYYVSKCGSCHALYLPEQYEKEVWIKNMDEMQERSNVSDAEKRLILLYLDHHPRKTGS
jgi:mono/diheme cytochrome c family protein